MANGVMSKETRHMTFMNANDEPMVIEKGQILGRATMSSVIDLAYADVATSFAGSEISASSYIAPTFITLGGLFPTGSRPGPSCDGLHMSLKSIVSGVDLI